jgi:hypothetical protein
MKEFYKTFGKSFRIRLTTKSVKEANDFCEANSGCGVIDETDGVIIVCENKEAKV